MQDQPRSEVIFCVTLRIANSSKRRIVSVANVCEMCSIDLSIAKKKYVWQGKTDKISVRARDSLRAAEKILDKMYSRYKKIPHRFRVGRIDNSNPRRVRLGRKKAYDKVFYFLSELVDEEILTAKGKLSWNDAGEARNFEPCDQLLKLCNNIGFDKAKALEHFEERFYKNCNYTLEQKLLYVLDLYESSLNLYDAVQNNPDTIGEFLGVKHRDAFWIRKIGGEIHVGGFDTHESVLEFGCRNGILRTYVSENKKRKEAEDELEKERQHDDLLDGQAESIVKLSCKNRKLKKRHKAASEIARAERRRCDEMELRAVQNAVHAEKMETSFMEAEKEITELKAKLDSVAKCRDCVAQIDTGE